MKKESHRFHSFFSIFPLLLLLLIVSASICPSMASDKSLNQDPSFLCSRNWKLDSLFGPALGMTQKSPETYLGGDGFFTMDLGDGRILAIFGDTFIGNLEGLKRKLTRMVNNSCAIINLRPGSTAQVTSVDYFIGQGAPLFPAPGENFFYWPLDGFVSNGVLCLFAALIEKTGDQAFGFREAGNTLFLIKDFSSTPDKWKPQAVNVPWSRFSDKGYLMWGSSVTPSVSSAANELLIYGVWCREGKKRMVLARTGSLDRADFSDWEFLQRESTGELSWKGGKMFGNRGLVSPTPLLDDISNEFSVHRAGKRGYMLVTTPVGMSPHIEARFSDSGSFTEKSAASALRLYRCPEHGLTKNIFTYSAKAVKPLCTDDKAVLVYFSNSFDFWEPLRDLRLYWPRFLDLELSQLP